jgi:hypothetical protein
MCHQILYLKSNPLILSIDVVYIHNQATAKIDKSGYNGRATDWFSLTQVQTFDRTDAADEKKLFARDKQLFC